ncbi:MAG: helix-turn-helix transcriptional regulator [Gammaproteobacteria bacterium]|jgi:excisionase family DNA binding protein|nr:helix-turn-helix transcriptional regulator [Gammaproteobacteria bacterium]
MLSGENAYLTTRELAQLLRIRERKVYDLAASGQIPCSRAMGKLLFPRQAVEAWIAGESSGGAAAKPCPAVFLGSYEPLLEWALRESGCDLAMLLDGSTDGLERFVRGEGVAAGMHIYDAALQTWNVTTVSARLLDAPVALIEFTWRERGLIVAPGSEGDFADVAALRGRRVVPRQSGAGSQVLLDQLLEQAGVAGTDVRWTDIARTESDAALAVLEGKADVSLGLRALAERLRLGFVPLLRERYDILVDRAAWFDPPLQTLMRFCRTPAFAAKAAEFAGYDVAGLGTVRFNGGRGTVG